MMRCAPVGSVPSALNGRPSTPIIGVVVGVERNVARERDVAHAGDGAKLVDERRNVVATSAGDDTSPRQTQSEHDETTRAEAERDVLRLANGRDHERGAVDEDAGERDLRDEQRAPNARECVVSRRRRGREAQIARPILL